MSYQAGRPDELAAAAADMKRSIRTSGQPFFDFVGACVEGGLAYLRGDFAGAERWAGVALGTGSRLGADSTEGSHGVQMFMLRRETGELAQFGGFLDGTETFVGRWVPGLLALYTELCCEPGMTRALGHLLDRNLGDHTAEAQWPMELVFMTEAALALGDREAVAALRPFVAHYEGKNVMSGQFVALFGSADRYLARIAALVGETALAEEYLQHRTADGPAHGIGGARRRDTRTPRDVRRRLRSHRGCAPDGRGGSRDRRTDRSGAGSRSAEPVVGRRPRTT